MQTLCTSMLASSGHGDDIGMVSVSKIYIHAWHVYIYIYGSGQIWPGGHSPR